MLDTSTNLCRSNAVLHADDSDLQPSSLQSIINSASKLTSISSCPRDDSVINECKANSSPDLTLCSPSIIVSPQLEITTHKRRKMNHNFTEVEDEEGLTFFLEWASGIKMIDVFLYLVSTADS
jgi:hypothetical protein